VELGEVVSFDMDVQRPAIDVPEATYTGYARKPIPAAAFEPVSRLFVARVFVLPGDIGDVLTAFARGLGGRG